MPVVLYLVWTLVLFVSSLIVLSCLNRETKKFNKRLHRADNRVRMFLLFDAIFLVVPTRTNPIRTVEIYVGSGIQFT